MEKFKFIDLFCGIGGFHQAMRADHAQSLQIRSKLEDAFLNIPDFVKEINKKLSKS